MRLFYPAIIALCLVASSGKGMACNQADSDNLQNVSHYDARNTEAPRTQTSVPTDHQSLRTETGTNAQDNQEKPSKWAEPIFLATAAYVLVSVFMLLALRSQGKQIDKQIALSDAQRIEMIEQSEHMRRQWRAMHEQDITLREQLEEMVRLTNETKTLANATLKTARATMRSVKLQEAALTQWIVLKNWETVIAREKSAIELSIDVVNASTLPLMLDIVSVKFWRGSFAEGHGPFAKLLPPDVPQQFTVICDLNERQFADYKQGGLVLALECEVVYRTILEHKRGQHFSGALYCGDGITAVFHEWVSKRYDSTPEEEELPEE